MIGTQELILLSFFIIIIIGSIYFIYLLYTWAIGQQKQQQVVIHEDSYTKSKGGKIMNDKMFCSNCGAEIDSKAEICPKCGVRIRPAKEQKNPGLAAILSFFFTGLGQIYNGQIGKGLIFIIIGGLLALSMFIVIGFLLYPIFWIYNIYDAYKTAERINTDSI